MVLSKHGELADLARRQRVSLSIDHRHPVPRIGSAHRARTGRPSRSPVADQIGEAGRPEDTVDGHTHFVSRPVPQRLIDRLADTRQRTQVEIVDRAGFRHLLHHPLQERRPENGVANTVLFDQGKDLCGVQAPVVREQRHAEMPGRQQGIPKAAGPRGFARRPEHVPRLRKEVMRADERTELAEQHAVRHQGTPGVTAAIEDHRRIAGRGDCRRVARRSVLEHLVPGADARSGGAANAEHVPQQGQPVAQPEYSGLRRRIDDGQVGGGIAQAVFQRIRPQERRQRDGQRAHLANRDLRDGRFRTLRQDDRHPVARQRTQCREHVREPVRLSLNVPEGVRRGESALVLVVQREAVTLLGPAAADVHCEIELLRDLPAKAPAKLLVTTRLTVEFHPVSASVAQEAAPRRSSISSIQCRTGTLLPLCRCVWHPILAVTSSAGEPARIAASLLSRNCVASTGWLIE